MALSFAEKAAFQRFAEHIVVSLKDAILNKKISNFNQSAVDASGKLHDSIEWDFTDDGVQILANDYIYYLEYGRKPSQKKSSISSGNGQSLYDQILQWMKVKGIFNLNMTNESLAFLITRKIHKEGTTIWRQNKGKPSGLLASAINDDAILDLSDELGNSMIELITSEIIKDIDLQTLNVLVT